MTALNFLPLLGWALGFLALGIWDDHLRRIDGRDKVDKSDGDSFAEIYLAGCACFSLVGVVSAVW